MDTAKRLDLEEINKAFQAQVETTDNIRKLASWGDESNLSYIHLKEKFNDAIYAFELSRRITRLKLIEYKHKFGDDEKLTQIQEVIDEADNTMNDFLREIYKRSNNEVFNYTFRYYSINLVFEYL